MFVAYYLQQAVGDIVTADFRTASVFRENGIDFCCGGHQSLEEACKEAGVDSAQLIDQIEALGEPGNGNSINYGTWDLDFLCDYIVNTHHSYVKKELPELVLYTRKIAMAHGDNHPELDEVADLMLAVETELTNHMQKEEETLFPAIKQALAKPFSGTLETIATEIERMTGEHEFAGNSMHRINALTYRYQVPEDACNTYMLALRMLNRFEDDLHIHVHLENNILFQKALKL